MDNGAAVVVTGTTVDDAAAASCCCAVGCGGCGCGGLATTPFVCSANRCVSSAAEVSAKAAVLRYIEEGAAGYVVEEDSLGDLVRKIRRVYANEFLVSPHIGGALIARLAELKRRVNSVRTMSALESFHEPAELTPREWEILRLIEQGMSNQEIANSLVIEMGTVKNHVHNILRKLDVQSRNLDT